MTKKKKPKCITNSWKLHCAKGLRPNETKKKNTQEEEENNKVITAHHLRIVRNNNQKKPSSQTQPQTPQTNNK
jgi:hypothetical protein